jgi:hypothetical protein
VVFEAGHLGGWTQITAVSLISGQTKYKDRKQCAKSIYISSKFSTVSGLNLNLTRKDLVARFGLPSAEKNGRMLYVYEVTERAPMVRSEVLIDWDVYSTIEAVFNDKGELTSIEITKTVSG